MAQEMEGVPGILKTTIRFILIEYLLNKKVDVWFVPQMLFPMPKQCRMELCQKHLTHCSKKGIAFLQRIIPIDGTYERDFKPEL